MSEKQHKVESDKYSRAKELRAYRVVIRGEIPIKIGERLSAIHAKAILKTRNKTEVELKMFYTPGQVSREYK